ncbi:LLM class oxidoreductase [Microbulbifer sp. VAAF005]|uniref:LLM class oxidoreductase n=1 Tax=Microbulbifer sp. VAAF005 TaxID=3034230 RepID=UPI0024ADEA28|nr:LLM class oxidoreductase [Microbulbifer sp. VAAF005]WHI47384.1 LLM class oxidoreductase [Microbulbifer sp. VAAF005]
MHSKYKDQGCGFASINAGYNALFKPGKLSVGLVVAIENYATNPVPTMLDHVERVQLAEELGFSAIWLRDVPFYVHSFGDAGQTFDPFVYLGLLSGQTTKITLGVASIILPLRHPAHIAKAAASVDQISGGRLILGVASGDRPEEYPAMNVSYQERGKLFRESYEYIRRAAEPYPQFQSSLGSISGDLDILPKPRETSLPLLITGSSQQSLGWLGDNGDGWITYPRSHAIQEQFIRQLRNNSTINKPIMEPLYIDISDTPDALPHPIHLGYRLGINQLCKYLKSREEIGVNHVALNLRFNQADIKETLKAISEVILPHFSVKE